MSSRFTRAAVVGVAALAISGLTSVPANAVQLAATQVTVCNRTWGQYVRSAWLTGTSDDGRIVSTATFHVGYFGSCSAGPNWWWQVNTSIRVNFFTDSGNGQQSYTDVVRGGSPYEISLTNAK